MWKHLKKHIPPSLKYDDYVKDPWGWMMCACWRARVIGDPFLALGKLLHGKEEVEGDVWESGSENESSEEDSSDEESSED